MESYRKMFMITSPFPTKMAIPSGSSSPYRGNIPLSIVIYTRVGTLLARLQEGTEGTRFEINEASVEYLLAILSIKDGEYVEFETHSNTDLIVRAYDSRGREKNIGKSRSIHSKLHYQVELDPGFRNRLDISTAFTPPFNTLGPNPLGLMTRLGHHWVTGTTTGDGGFRFNGRSWEMFRQRHELRQGMILVFEHTGFGFNYNVLFYNQDGSEATAISRNPADGLDRAEISFYKSPHDIAFDGPGLRLGTHFVTRNWSLLTPGVRMVSAAGIFNMEYDTSSQDGYVITGDWNTVLLNSATDDITLIKFSLSLNSSRVLSSRRCTIFLVGFKDSEEEGSNQPVREMSFEVSDDPNCSSDEDSICTQLMR